MTTFRMQLFAALTLAAQIPFLVLFLSQLGGEDTKRFGLAWLFLSPILGFGAFLVAKKMADPIRKVTEGAYKVANLGELDNLNKATCPSDFRELAKSLLFVANEERACREGLEQVERRFKSLQLEKQKLADRNLEMAAVLEASLEGVLIVQKDGHFSSVNQKFCEFFGVNRGKSGLLNSADLESRIAEVVDDITGFEGFTKELQLGNEEMANSSVPEAEWRIGNPERFLRVYCVDVKTKAGGHIAHLWVFRDITEARHMETELQQAQKMEAVGRLAGGIAHDFNNLLTGIIGNLALVSLELNGQDKALSHLITARQASERAADLVKRLLGYSRQTYLNLTLCDPKSLVEEVGNFVGSTFDPTKVRLKTKCAEDVWDFQVDSNQISQVLMNLSVNAYDALMEVNGGSIQLMTRNVKFTDQDALEMGVKEAKGGDFVEISVKDNGPGVPANVITRIFEPFFTTKEQGKGTGLGLATSYGIVKQHGGWILCKSELGKGAEFLVYLPRNASKSEVIPMQLESPWEENREATETILLVDDEKVVRMVSEKFLTRKGYEIILAEDGEKALDQYRQHQGEIDLIMLDLTMPKLSGADTFQELRKLDPDLPIVIYSGYEVEADEFEAKMALDQTQLCVSPLIWKGYPELSTMFWSKVDR